MHYFNIGRIRNEWQVQDGSTDISAEEPGVRVFKCESRTASILKILQLATNCGEFQINCSQDESLIFAPAYSQVGHLIRKIREKWYTIIGFPDFVYHDNDVILYGRKFGSLLLAVEYALKQNTARPTKFGLVISQKPDPWHEWPRNAEDWDSYDDDDLRDLNFDERDELFNSDWALMDGLYEEAL